MNVERYIGELLYDYECVVVPGFGGFISNKKPAKVNRITHQFFPPYYQLFFNVHLTENDGLLINYVAKREKITFKEAKQAVEDYVTNCREKLETGERLIVPRIGSLTQDSSGNIYFQQESKVNYNPESFGLSEFVSPQIKRESDETKIRKLITPVVRPEKQAEPVKLISRKGLNRLITRAAIFILLVSTISWGFINLDKVEAYVTSYASVNPFTKKKPVYQPRPETSILENSAAEINDEKTSTTTDQQDQSTDLAITDPSAVEVSPTESKEVAKEIAVEPEPRKTVIEPADKPEMKTKEESKPVVPVRTGKTYYIIAGSFEKQMNAERLVQQLKSKGFNAQIADTNKYGMYRVAFEGYGTLTEAKERLYAIRNEDNAEAWILKK